VWLIPAFPLAGAVALLLFGPGLRRVAGGLASLLVGASFVVGLLVFQDLLSKGARHVAVHVFDWISAGSFAAPVELRVDPLSMVMVLVVTGVGFLIHVYSMDYMHEDPRYPRYFAYLNLFVAAMLTLVLANNFVLMFVGWEGVGLCSYLLIAFWYERKSAADAGKKAFIVTRIGDTAMLIGIFLIFATFGSVEFGEVFGAAEGLSQGVATAIALLLFAGAVGKSAQLPLHTWLPDAMEGPTPVSALIHAATMVTAGVYLVARTHVFFEVSDVALGVVAVVGLVTAVYAGLSALAQDDLKRVLAYSTISQLGYMFVAAGVGAYPVAIFHLVSHAFFKALLFLAAGNVMHATDGEVDMTKLGGLRKQMPVTAALFALGGAALAGIPLLVGFFSKDQVLAAAYEAGRTGIWIVGLLAAGLTALYITRAYAMTFAGEPRHQRHPHEAPALMRWPMLVLGVLTLLGGVLGASVREGRIQGFLQPVFGEAHHGVAAGGLSELTLAIIASLVALGGVGFGWYVYGSGRVSWRRLRERWAGPKRTMERGFYLDDLYGRGIVMPGKAAAELAATRVDRDVIDGAVNGLGRAFAGLAQVGRRVQTGLVRTYALGFLAGVVALVLLLVVRSW
ncbi:MAG TPA: NADH-quinone oxidoreductase subunit L, partial [Gemmatimonadales bacterium]|nr:NADH-quinone oxidoreductase subunit L [Gemmatimonadales bacterium]